MINENNRNISNYLPSVRSYKRMVLHNVSLFKCWRQTRFGISRRTLTQRQFLTFNLGTNATNSVFTIVYSSSVSSTVIRKLQLLVLSRFMTSDANSWLLFLLSDNSVQNIFIITFFLLFYRTYQEWTSINVKLTVAHLLHDEDLKDFFQ